LAAQRFPDPAHCLAASATLHAGLGPLTSRLAPQQPSYTTSTRSDAATKDAAMPIALT